MNALTRMMLADRDAYGGHASVQDGPPPVGRRRLLIGIGIAALIAAAVGYWVFARDEGPQSPTQIAKQRGAVQEVPSVTVMQPTRARVATTVNFNGTIAARYDMPISVEGDGGRIDQVLVEAGDRVNRGELLARLNTAVLRPQVEQLVAALEEARASASLAAADYARARQVAESGALSREEIDRRRAAAATAAARAKVVAAQLNEARARLARTDVRAPTAGLILTRTAEVGQTAMAGGEPLFRMARGGEVEMRGMVAEQDLPALKVGQPVSVSLTGIAQPFVGKVRLLGAVIDPQSRQGSVRVALESDPLLRPGAFAKAKAEIADGERLVVPQTAVLVDDAGSYVFTVGADNRVVRTTVTLDGATAQGVIIASGLDGSEQVVAAAAGFLNVGEKIKPLRAGADR